ncbi:hypothetical protein MOO45_02285 [Bombilactobacillus folatiphilus]|uniref:Cell surface protein n=1 Tax=Bombilactobacillus folatiphilus TaxID=2923362 RepID=A0ABY4PA68_9LACO|nr:hypothetical protein [Bombilactobacillus folatiphilus]UQS82500.1 hypothetical protein MOO45_02285 [Bombilactobacillus folatiphilus]
MSLSGSSYQDIATYLPGDTLNFKLDYTINTDVSQFKVQNVDASDIHAKLKKSADEPGTDLTATNNSPGNFTIKDPASKPLLANSTIEITFSKTISKTDTPPNSVASQVTAYAKPIITNQVISADSNKVTAYLMDTTYFTSVPDRIDFGSLIKNATGIYGDSSTASSLKVTHYSPSTSSNYQVKVAYDSTDANQQLTSTSGQKINDVNALQLKQSDGSYAPLTSDGLPLNSTGFNKLGVTDLTPYINNKWRLMVNNPQAGNYKGTIKWTLTSSLE